MPFRASPWLVAYPADGTFVVENLHSRRRFVAPPSLLVLLGRFDDWRSDEDSVAILAELGARPETFDRLVTAGVLVDERSSDTSDYARASKWRDFGWDEALRYYAAVRDYPFLDYSERGARASDTERMAQYADLESVPDPYKTYDGPTTPLETPDLDLVTADVGSLLVDEAMPEAFCGQLSQALSTLLYLTFGQTAAAELPGQGMFVLRTSPSGGARHPIEAYVVPLTDDLAWPVAHYSVRNHELDGISLPPSADAVKAALHEFGYPEHHRGLVAIVLTGVVERSMWRYREPRSYRVVHHDLGHLMETLKLVARTLGLSTLCSYAFDPDRLNSILALDDPILEPILGYAIVGTAA